jgi:hypothetical protein
MSGSRVATSRLRAVPAGGGADRRPVSDLPQHHRGEGLRQSLKRLGEPILPYRYMRSPLETELSCAVSRDSPTTANNQNMSVSQ